jgi:hypothetical protein
VLFVLGGKDLPDPIKGADYCRRIAHSAGIADDNSLLVSSSDLDAVIQYGAPAFAAGVALIAGIIPPLFAADHDVRVVPQHQSWQTLFLLDLKRLRAEMSCIRIPSVAGPSPTWASDFVSQM